MLKEGIEEECGYLHCIATYRQKEELKIADAVENMRETIMTMEQGMLDQQMSPPSSGEPEVNQGILELQLKECHLDKTGLDKQTSFSDLSSRMYCMIEVSAYQSRVPLVNAL